jgi:perosamine synthetase
MGAVLGLRRQSSTAVTELLKEIYRARSVMLTDSGTSALILLLRELIPEGGTVGFPSYACMDLTTAAIGADVKVRLYDIDPVTLSPDLDSVERLFERGVDAIVVAHLYGYPADLPAVQRLAEERGIPVIEDAAQGAGGTLFGATLGGFGDASILSFGRGKGTTAGSGGALVARSSSLAERLDMVRTGLKSKSRGGVTIMSLLAQDLFSHPSLYGIPASIPALRLGETVYRPPQSPHAMSAGSIAVLGRALALAPGEVAARCDRARDLLSVLHSVRDIVPVRPIAGGESGYLRLAVLDSSGSRRARPELGVLRGYPMTLDQHSQLQPFLHPNEVAGVGSRQLRDRLFTIPTHARLARSFSARVMDWLTVEHLSPRFVPVIS